MRTMAVMIKTRKTTIIITITIVVVIIVTVTVTVKVVKINKTANLTKAVTLINLVIAKSLPVQNKTVSLFSPAE